MITGDAVIKQLGSQRFHTLVEPRLLPSRLILVHDALGDHFVYDRHRLRQRSSRSFAVVGFDSTVNPLDVGADHGPLTGIVRSALFRLLKTTLAMTQSRTGDLHIGRLEQRLERLNREIDQLSDEVMSLASLADTSSFSGPHSIEGGGQPGWTDWWKTPWPHQPDYRFLLGHRKFRCQFQPWRHRQDHR